MLHHFVHSYRERNCGISPAALLRKSAQTGTEKSIPSIFHQTSSIRRTSAVNNSHAAVSVPKLYTSFLRSKCVRCQSVPKIPVLCLLCGAVLCCNAECCQHGVVGEVTHHYRSTCCPGGIGIFLQLSMSMVVLVSTERNRTVIAEWGSLYTDSHGEEDFGLSKPLMLNPDRVRKLVNELREQSWVWKGGSKELPWKFSTGII